MILLGCAGFLWFNEINELYAKLLNLRRTMSLGKTDVYRSGKDVLIA